MKSVFPFNRSSAIASSIFLLNMPILFSTLAHAHEEEPQPEIQSGGTQAQVEGEIKIVIFSNFEKNKSRTEYHLVESDSKKGKEKNYRLLFANTDSMQKLKSSLKPNQKAKIKGLLKGSELVVLGAEGSPTDLNEKGPESGVPAYPLKGGTKKVLVVTANFKDVVGTNGKVACDAATISNHVFGASQSVASVLKEASFNQFSLTGIVTPTAAEISMDDDNNSATPPGCNFSTWSRDAELQLASQGINKADYDYFIYVFPPESASHCTNSAAADLLGQRTFMFGLSACAGPRVYTHEFGHNLGLHHASRKLLSGDGPEYGDEADAMGTGNTTHFGGTNKIYLGWIPTVRTTTITQAGTYTLKPLESNDGGVQVLHIEKYNASGQSYGWRDLFVTYRRPVGYDAGLFPVYADKIQIHEWLPPYLTNHWGDPAPNNKSYLFGAYGDREEFVHPQGRISIKMLSHNADSAQVKVEFIAAQEDSAPAVRFSNVTSGQLLAGKMDIMVDARDLDNTPVSMVVLKLNGWIFGQNLPPYWSVTNIFGIDTELYSNGKYWLEAIATDASGRSSSASVELKIENTNSRPLVNISMPGYNSNVFGVIPVRVSAVEQNNGGMLQLDTLLDDAVPELRSSASSPVRFLLNTGTYSVGAHSLKARAFNNEILSSSYQIPISIAATMSGISVPADYSGIAAPTRSGCGREHSSGTYAQECNGHVEAVLNFPVAGSYQITVDAHGTLANSIWPAMAVKLDGTAFGNASVNSSSPKVFTFKRDLVSAGTHRLAIALTNSYINGTTKRTLFINGVGVAKVPDPAPSPSPLPMPGI